MGAFTPRRAVAGTAAVTAILTATIMAVPTTAGAAMPTTAVAAMPIMAVAAIPIMAVAAMPNTVVAGVRGNKVIIMGTAVTNRTSCKSCFFICKYMVTLL